MTDRVDRGGGGLTGATGDLTPEDTDRAFVPGERREVEDRETRATVTVRQGAAAPAQVGDVGDPAGERIDRGPTELAERESGYGSVHGLAPDDPAYRMEVNPPAPTEEEGAPPPAEPRIGGDRISDHDERL